MMNFVLLLAFPLSSNTLKLHRESAFCDPLNNIYIINLEGQRGETRRNLMAAELKLHNLSATFYPAADLATINEWHTNEERKAADKLRRADDNKFTRHHHIKDFDIALSKSHKNIYQEIQKKSLPCALILEDDVNFACNFKSRLQQFVLSDEMPKDFDIVKLDHCSKKIPDTSVAELKVLNGSQGPCASAYIVSSGGAKLLEAANTPIWLPADGIMDPNHLKHSNARQYLPLKDFAVTPQIAYQANEDVAGGRKAQLEILAKCGQNK